jgi:hypothetical protein
VGRGAGERGCDGARGAAGGAALGGDNGAKQRVPSSGGRAERAAAHLCSRRTEAALKWS